MQEIIEYGWKLRIDRGPQRLAAEVTDESDLQPRLSPSPRFVSAGELAFKAKQVDDRVVAALELWAQRSVKAAWLADLAARTRDAHLCAACALGGQQIELDAPARAVRDRFLADANKSKPIGFWSQSEELGRLFRQDRLLQESLPGASAVRAALALAPYESLLRFAACLTNPFDQPDLRTGEILLPPSRSPETSLLRRLFGNAQPPADFSLIEELAGRVRSGKVDLRPQPDSGFYDWTLAALEPLLRPPGERIKFLGKYRRHLEELARAVWAQARETHVKSLAVAIMAAPPGGPVKAPPPKIRVPPGLTVEPLPDYYALRADSYRFLREHLEDPFRPREVLDELELIESIFRGAEAVARGELGEATGGDTRAFRSWTATRRNDPDLAQDPRMMVPVWTEPSRIKVWAILGWTSAEAEIWYDRRHPQILSLETAGATGPKPEVTFIPEERTLWRPVMVEIYVRTLLNRKEFQALCDQRQSMMAILMALQR